MPRRHLGPQNLPLRNFRRISPFTPSEPAYLPLPSTNQDTGLPRPAQEKDLTGGAEWQHTAHHSPSPYRSWNLRQQSDYQESSKQVSPSKDVTLRNKTLQMGINPEHLWLWAQLGSHQRSRSWDQIMTGTYRKWIKAAVLKLWAEAPGKCTGHCCRVLIWDTEASVGHHTNSLQGVGHTYLINLTISAFFLVLGNRRKKCEMRKYGNLWAKI